MKKLLQAGSSSCSASAPWVVASLLLTLLFPCCHPQHQEEMEGRAEKENLTLLSLLPYPADPEEGEPQPSWDEGYTLFITQQMAVERLNKHSNILPGYQVMLDSSDSGCNIKSKATLSVVRDTLANKAPIVGLVGPGCSGSASTIGPLTGREKIALINVHGAGSTLLANRTTFPLSFGTLDSTGVFVETLLAMIKSREWKHVSALYDESRLYYYSTIQLMEKILSEGSNPLDYFSSAVYSTHIPLNIIKNSYRVVLLFVGPDFLSKILCLALKNGMVHPVYQYVIVSRTAEEINNITFTYDNNKVTCTKADILKIINNAVVIHYQLRPVNETAVTDSGLSYREFDEIYRKKVAEFIPPRDGITIEPSFWAPAFFDAVWSLGLALNNSMETVNLSAYRFHHPEDSAIIRDRLQELNYEGVSGRICFNNDTGYAQRNVAIYQINSTGSMINIGNYYRLSRAINLTENNFIIRDGEFENLTIILTAPKPLGVIVLIITAIGFAMVLMLQILTVHYSNFKSIKATSPRISQLAFVGCYIQVLASVVNVYVDAFTETITPATNCILWHVLNIAAAIGTTLIFGTVCVKTWRLYRIFVHFKNPGKFMSERVLISCVLLFVLANIIISVVWVSIDPFVSCKHTNENEFEEVNPNGNETVNIRIIKRVIYICKQKYFVVWCVLLILVNSVFMGGAVILAFLTRHIRYKDFKTRGIMSMTYVLTGILGLGFSLYTILLTQQSYSVLIFRFIVVSMLLNLYIYLSCFLLFLPPLYPLIREKLAKWTQNFIRMKQR